MRTIKYKNHNLSKYLMNCGTLSLNETAFQPEYQADVKSCTCNLCSEHLNGFSQIIVAKNVGVDRCSVLGCTDVGQAYDLSGYLFEYPFELIRLGEDFLTEMKCQDLDLIAKAQVLELLYLVFEQYVDLDRSEVAKMVFTDDIMNEYHLFKLVDLAGYWSNDLIDIVVDYLKSIDILTSFTGLEPQDIWATIHEWVKKKTGLTAR